MLFIKDIYRAELDVNTRFSIYKECGFNGIGLGCVPNEVLSGFATEHGLSTKMSHLEWENANLIWDDEKEGDRYINRLKKDISGFAKLGVRILVMHPSRGDTPPPPNKVGLARILELLNICEQLDIILAIENVRSTENLDYIFDNINHKNLKICFDTGHANCHQKNVLNMYQKYRDKIICMHLHDNYGEKDEHNAIGNGNIDFNKFFSVASPVEYYLLECFPKEEDLSPDEFKKFVSDCFASTKLISSKSFL